jgi:hypothetical protein
MLDALGEHIRLMHGLAQDKELFGKLHGYLSHHLREAGFLEDR